MKRFLWTSGVTRASGKVSVRVLSGIIGQSSLSLFHQSKSDTLTLREGDGWGLAVTNDLHVLSSGGEDSALGVSDVGDVEGAWVSLDGLEHTDSADVVSAGDDDGGTIHELDNAVDLLGFQIELNKIAFRLIDSDYY